ncbi:MAG: family 20 glycosylhydrolase [Sphingobacteriales bacterium]|nr:family 20 glycosylhydrolase [Sphingobacteriales bacterium]
MKLFSCLLAMMSVTIINAQTINIIPQPKLVKQSAVTGNFNITSATQIVLEGSGLENSVNFLNSHLQKYYRLKLKTVNTSASKNVIRLNYERLDNPLPGAYNMTVDENGVYITGDNETGVFYGIQSLIQLLPTYGKLTIPYASIEDAPRFGYRGMHLDCGRHFWPIDYIKKYLDYLALHKINIFHWHLTEDQGWRVEIKKYPELTKVGAWRNGTIIGRYPGTGNDNIRYGGYYTQEEIKQVVQYAKERYVEVIPEIEMPGHSSAAIASYPWLSCFSQKSTPVPANMISKKSVEEQKNGRIKLVQETWGVFDDVFCAGSDSSFLFLQNVIDEVIGLFPSRYFHIGGDECPKTHWKICPKCQQRMKVNNLKDEHELQSWFVQRIEKYLNSKGKILIGWDEILEGGLAPNAVVMSWRGEQGGIDAAKQNHDVIMTPGNPVYFDHTQSENEDSVTIGGFNPIEKVYAYEPVPKELNAEQATHVLGAQANIWTEYMGNTRKVEYMLFPRLSALSEVLWSPKENRSWDDFQKRLLKQFNRYDLWKVNYSKAYFDLKATVIPTENNSGVLYKLESKLGNDSILFAPGGGNPKPQFYKTPILVTQSRIINAFQRVSGGISNIIYQKFSFNKATGKKITLTNPASDKYPGDGAFTLVNGVINEKGFARSREFLGFNGTDCEAIIDLGEIQPISFIVINCLNRTSSWIWRPLTAEVLGSSDGQTWYSLKLTDDFEERDKNTGKGVMTMSFKQTYTQYVKVIVKNWGEIPDGYPGAGHKPWLFVDEIEVN